MDNLFRRPDIFQYVYENNLITKEQILSNLHYIYDNVSKPVRYYNLGIDYDMSSSPGEKQTMYKTLSYLYQVNIINDSDIMKNIAQIHDFDMLEFLLKNSPNPGLIKQKYIDNSLLYYAMRYYKPDLIKLFLDNGGCEDIKRSTKFTYGYI